MSDKDSDDDGDDERMDRARRIRRMREGKGDDDTDDSTGSAEPAESTDSAETDDSEDTSQPDTERTTRADEAHTRASSTTDQTESTGESETDPEAIARRAAQAAADISDVDDSPPVDMTEPARETTGFGLPDQEEIEAAIEESDGQANAETTPAPSSVVDSVSTDEELTRVLGFTLAGEHYCVDIELVEEIVTLETITRVPNTDDYVEGVVDLRGQITTVLDPKRLLDIDREGTESLMIVFDPEAFEDQGAIGWIVDEVQQVEPIYESETNDPPIDEEYMRGVVDRDDQEEFVIWTDPQRAIELAIAEESAD
jgi:purine-binding chemotaxis protein CheW